MIFMSAQPDEQFFIWQLEINHFNLERLGVDMSTVYALVGYKNEVSAEFRKFADESKANILFYPVDTGNVAYISTVRPNIIKKFVKDYPQFINEYVYYHDADTMFRELPLFIGMQDGRWHLSNTNSYINYDYIVSKGEQVLIDMCGIVGISPQRVKDINENSGGAQYFIPMPDYNFWDKVERDSENMFRVVNANNSIYEKLWIDANKEQHDTNMALVPADSRFELTYHPLQIWCSDMWAVLWNGVLKGNAVINSKEMDFCLGSDNSYRYYQTKIFHNSGYGPEWKGKLVYKTDYKHKTPYGEDFNYISSDCASYFYAEEIRMFVASRVNPEGFSVFKAVYKGVNNSIDVTPQVVSLLNTKKSFRVENKYFGDVEAGVVKSLIINDLHVFKENEIVFMTKPKNVLGIFYTNNNVSDKILEASIKSIERAANSRADIVTCSWEDIKDNPFIALRSKYKESSHLNIVLQVLQCLLYAKNINNYEYVSFLEHDVLYPEDYFIIPSSRPDVYCNMNYIGVNKNGYQSRMQNDEPLHQITMKFEIAIRHFIKLAKAYLIDAPAMLEPNGLGISHHYTIYPSVHVNHGHNFTSHYAIYNEGNGKTHEYWGSNELYI